MKTDQQIRQEISSLRKLLRERKRKAHGEPKRRKGMGVRIGDRDEAEKLKRGYVEAGSFVRRDGSEKLVGVDWMQRKHELYYRSGGVCERFTILGKSHDSFCDRVGAEPHHVVRRSTRRDDRMSNLALLSHACHLAEDPRKVRSGKVGA